MKLQLSLKRKWFDMTKAGIKDEDYREINEYWIKRLITSDDIIESDIWAQILEELPHIQYYNTIADYGLRFKPFTTNRMTLGYPSNSDTERIIEFEHKGIEIRTGNPEWGAEEGKLYFCIMHGKQLK